MATAKKENRYVPIHCCKILRLILKVLAYDPQKDKNQMHFDIDFNNNQKI